MENFPLAKGGSTQGLCYNLDRIFHFLFHTALWDRFLSSTDVTAKKKKQVKNLLFEFYFMNLL